MTKQSIVKLLKCMLLDESDNESSNNDFRTLPKIPHPTMNLMLSNMKTREGPVYIVGTAVSGNSCISIDSVGWWLISSADSDCATTKPAQDAVANYVSASKKFIIGGMSYYSAAITNGVDIQPEQWVNLSLTDPMPPYLGVWVYISDITDQ